MIVALEKNRFLHFYEEDDLWYEDATRPHSDPTRDAVSTSSGSCEHR